MNSRTICDPCVILVFGATGDLARRKIFPALCQLQRKGFLHAATPIVGVTRQAMSRQAFIDSLDLKLEAGAGRGKSAPGADGAEGADGAQSAGAGADAFLDLVHCVDFDYTQATLPAFVESVDRIAARVQAGGSRAVYFALPAEVFEKTAMLLVQGGLFKDGAWRRIAFEKPFGQDLASAEDLNAKVTRHFDEHEIYRIDHYLGKELVRNIMVLRFANPLFSQMWNAAFVDHVQITIAETLGVENRAGYYEQAGAVRDMLQNHLMQVLALTAMESPASLDADDVRDAMVRVIEKLVPPAHGDFVLGQFGEGESDGQQVPGYRQEKGVDPQSGIDTFVALRVYIDTPRWFGVPFFLRTGKRMARKVAEANVVLREQPCGLFGAESSAAGATGPNLISIRIQPNEGISVEFNVKAPGEGMLLETVAMEHCHHCVYGINTAEAYEILLQEFLRGDPTLFTRWDFVRASWSHIDRLMQLRTDEPVAFPNYAAGTSGPPEAEALLGEGRRWLVSRDILV